MKIRPEKPHEAQAIFDLTKAAFEPMSFANDNDPYLTERLRRAGDLTLSLIVEGQDGEIVGHAAYSPAVLSGAVGHWHALGPISVTPTRQRQGVGRALIAEGLAIMRRMGSDGVVLIGNPAVYRSSGFSSYPDLTYRDLSEELVMAHPFGEVIPAGEILFAPALEAAP